jgi:cell division protease FtsH
MVCEWGMSDELGPLTYGKKEEQIFLGREIAQHRDFSDETARQIDNAVRAIVTNAVITVTELLENNKDILIKMTEELLEKETIVLDDIDKMIRELRPGKYPDVVKPAPAAPVEEVKADTVTTVDESEESTSAEEPDAEAPPTNPQDPNHTQGGVASNS